jgi:isopenicillin N synthase-like dioxygenase
VLFRIFHYPASNADKGWGVGEHTDYGLLTLLAQDDIGGLEVKTPRGWTEAPPIRGALVCNIGDMLDRLTGGAYRSTPHRVMNASGRSRLSFPFFFDPGFDARIVPLPEHALARDDSSERWDRSNVHAFSGTYGDYLLSKVSKVFPDLAQRVT